MILLNLARNLPFKSLFCVVWPSNGNLRPAILQKRFWFDNQFKFGSQIAKNYFDRINHCWNFCRIKSLTAAPVLNPIFCQQSKCESRIRVGEEIAAESKRREIYS